MKTSGRHARPTSAVVSGRLCTARPAPQPSSTPQRLRAQGLKPSGLIFTPGFTVDSVTLVKNELTSLKLGFLISKTGTEHLPQTCQARRTERTSRAQGEERANTRPASSRQQAFSRQPHRPTLWLRALTLGRDRTQTRSQLPGLAFFPFKSSKMS